MNVIAQTIRFENVSDGITYGFSRDVFETKCKDFKAVRNFLNDSINAINEVSEETATSLRNATDIVDEIDNFSLNLRISNMSLGNIGVDPVIAKSIFNISEDELNTLIEHGLDNLTNDEYLNDIQSSIRTLKETLQNQTDDANNINSVNQWMLAMESMTTEYFDNEVCVSFLDCSYYCISVLYEMFMESDFDNRLQFLDIISNLENSFFSLTGNFSHTIIDVNAFAREIGQYIDQIQGNNVFCSTPPVMIEPLPNTTLELGDTLEIKDDEIMEGYTSMVLSVPDITGNGTGRYHCLADNLVASLLFPAIFVNVTCITQL